MCSSSTTISYVTVLIACVSCFFLPPHIPSTLQCTAQAPSDHLLRQFARPVAQQTTNWGRLALFLGLLPTDATNSQLFHASPEERAYHLLRQWRERQCGTTHALKTILTEAGIVLNVPPPSSVSSNSEGSINDVHVQCHVHVHVASHIVQL